MSGPHGAQALLEDRADGDDAAEMRGIVAGGVAGTALLEEIRELLECLERQAPAAQGGGGGGVAPSAGLLRRYCQARCKLRLALLHQTLLLLACLARRPDRHELLHTSPQAGLSIPTQHRNLSFGAPARARARGPLVYAC